MDQPKRRADWVQVAQQLLQGDAAAQAAGHPGQLNRPQLEALHAEAQQVVAQMNQTALTLQGARKTVQEARAAAQKLCRAVVSELRQALHTEPAAFRRQIMRAYGVPFQQAPESVASDSAVELVAPPTVVH